MNRALVVFVVSLCACGVYAQPANPISGGTKRVYDMVKNYVIKSAQEMPEENYSFKPAADVRSFGQLVGHVADAEYEFCGPIVNDGTKAPDVEKSKTAKADLIQALNTAFAYCDKAYDGLTDANAADMVSFFNRKTAKLVVLEVNIEHTSEHYGNMVTYLRMKGLVPPSSQHGQ